MTAPSHEPPPPDGEPGPPDEHGASEGSGSAESQGGPPPAQGPGPVEPGLPAVPDPPAGPVERAPRPAPSTRREPAADAAVRVLREAITSGRALLWRDAGRLVVAVDGLPAVPTSCLTRAARDTLRRNLRALHADVLGRQPSEPALRAMTDALLAEADRVPRERSIQRGVTPKAGAAPAEADVDAGPVEFERESRGDFKDEAGRVLDLAQELGLEAWRTAGDELYISLNTGHRVEHLPITARKVKNILKRAYYEKYDAAVKAEPLNDAMGVIEGRALGGPVHEVFTRVAEHDGAVYVDLADEEGRVVAITRRGWRVETHVPVRFRRPPGMLALPTPERGGSVEELRPLLNLPDGDAWVLLVGYLIGCLCPRGPFIVLVLMGEKGTAKSTATRIVVDLVDPKDPPLRRPPRDERDLAIAARHDRLLAFNNVSILSRDLSDALSALATEGGFATRSLFTDDEEARFRDRRPIVINGIPDFVTRGDLADRSIKISLAPILRKRRQRERVLLKRLEAVRPRVLGALYDSVVHALATHEDIELPSLPRMADAVQWITAAEPALGWEPGTFLAAFDRAIDEANVNVIESDPVALALRDFAKEQPWRGSATELLAELGRQAPDGAKRKGWPQTPQAMRSALVRCAPELRAAGVHVVQDEKQASRQRTRLWTVALRAVESSDPAEQTLFEADPDAESEEAP